MKFNSQEIGLETEEMTKARTEIDLETDATTKARTEIDFASREIDTNLSENYFVSQEIDTCGIEIGISSREIGPVSRDSPVSMLRENLRHLRDNSFSFFSPSTLSQKMPLVIMQRNG